VSQEDDNLIVITPLEDTPAFRAGILAGDQILEIDGEPIDTLSLQDCIQKVRGQPGTQITFTVLHKGKETPGKITLIREIIKIKSIKQAKIIDESHKIAYLRITSFQEDTFSTFTEAMQQLQNDGLKSLIIDLRFNGGGLLDEAVEIANRFIREGTIVSTKGRDPDANSVIKADPKKAIFVDLPIVVLVNGGTASASEILAGCLQDYSRGILVGSRTYGKGSVQAVFPVAEDKSSVKLTIAKYYTPSGKCIHREKGKKDYGLEPDVAIPMTSEQEAELFKARQEEEIINPDPNQPPKPTPFMDIQLKKAVEILSKK